MLEALAVCCVVVWLVRIAVEDGVAAVRGTTPARILRKRAREDAAKAAGVPTVGQAVVGRIASVLAPSPVGQRRRRPALEYVRTRWEDAWDELLESHHEEMRRRAQARRDRQARDAERLRREREDAADPYDDIIDAEVVDDPIVQPDPAEGKCPCGSAAVADGLCAECLNPPNPVCSRCSYRHMEGGPCPGQPTTGWRETTGGAERAGGGFHEDQDGDAFYRRWVQPHPRGDGSLRTTVTSWAQGDGTRRWIVTVTEWDWIGDSPSDRRFEGEDVSASDRDGPAGEPWPTAEDVRRTVDDIQPPAAPAETPLADVLDATVCPGCGVWSVGEGMCAECADRRALPPTPETPEPAGSGQHDPAPEQGPASTTQDSTDSGSAAHHGGTPMPETTYINPNIVDATGALRCAEGSLNFTRAVRRQMEKLGANAERGLRGDVPAVQAIRAFEADIAATTITINALVEEHVTHVRTQAELANDPNLKSAAIGYLDARHRA